jgi:metallo-beta-lactamase family protein
MPIHLEFFGAVGEVTGSRSVIEIGDSSALGTTQPLRIMVDCGLFQGPRESKQRNWEATSPRPSTIDKVVLTHAHLDHSGYLPRFYREGYRGQTLCSKGTAELARILLLDAAFLEEEQAAYARRTGYSHHKSPLPLFTEADANVAIDNLQACERNKWIQIATDASVQFLRAGHIIGASIVQFAIQDGDRTRLVTFSGDLGNDRSVTMRPPVDLVETDILVLESTYGARVQNREPPKVALGEIIRRTVARQGVVVIPAFAVGRTQEILYLIRQLEDERAIPSVPVILDSPMAISATQTFLRHPEDHMLASSFNGGVDHFLPKRFDVTRSSDESMGVCMQDGPLIVISASGMLSGGRILHHLKARISNPRNTVLFVGYQAEGTKGRFLLDEGKTSGKMRIFHQELPVEAEIESIETLSAHADQRDLLDWVGRMQRKPSRIFLNHGTVESAKCLAAELSMRFPEILTTPLEGRVRLKI